MASDYQGATIQVFVFLRETFLGSQCFGQDRITVGGSSGMDLPLSECTADQGSCVVYLSGGDLYVWYRGPVGGGGGQRPGEPRKVQPLDVFALGDYRFQVRLLEPEVLAQPPAGLHEATREANASTVVDREERSEPEPPPEPSLQEVRRTVAANVRSTGSQGHLESGCAGGPDLEDIPSRGREAGLREVRAGSVAAIEAEGDERPCLGQEVPRPGGRGAWGGSGLQDVIRAESGASLEAVIREVKPEDPLSGTGAREEPLPLEQEKPAAGPCGMTGRTTREARTRFWDDKGKGVFPQAEEMRGRPEVDGSPAEESSLRGSGSLRKEPGELRREPAAALLPEPSFGTRRPGGATAAVAVEASGIHERVGEDGQEEEDENQDITYFSLVKEVFPRRGQEVKTPRRPGQALEVVRFRGGDVQDVGYLESGSAYTLRKGWSRSLWKRRGGIPPNFKLVRLKNGGLAEIQVREAVTGRIYSPGGSRDIRASQGIRQGRFGRRSQACWLPLAEDTWAVLRADSSRYLVRYVPPRPRPAVQPLRPRVSPGQFKLLSLAVLSHIVLILMIGLVVPDRTLEGYSHGDHFARIDPDALKALKPPPPPKKLDEPKPLEVKDARPPAPKPAPARQRPVPTPEIPRVAEKKPVDLEQTGLLAALGGAMNSGASDANANSAILLAAVTNLDAVAVPSDTTTFNLAGIAGRLATSEIQVPTSDVIETVGAARLIKQGDGTLGAMAARSTGTVRAVVHEPPRADISIQGGMSREAVLKVVNEHLHEVRECYERELLHRPGLSGRILMEWLIQLDGRVRYAKVKFTNIGHSSDIHGCIQAQVVTWRFPRPTGGEEVLVTFPFLFESLGF